MPDFTKILVANRGEIAIRVMRTANELGKRTVAVFADQDKLSLHRFKSDEAYRIGVGLGPVEAYLSIEEIIRVAIQCGADAVHPGYGLLSENPEFAKACEAEGLAFIGPPSEVMSQLGNKASARKLAVAAGVPVIPATELLPDDISEIQKLADEIGYPLMMKASWGGGGRGMRPILCASELKDRISEGQREAMAAFGSSECFLERMIPRARHVEVQILGDHYGGIYHLFERDCTVQRRHQKIVERAPAPYLDESTRQELCSMGLRIAQESGYRNAGTVEFLMDMDTDAIYFIEVNPRIQVEHTVTEEITGIDIVRAQILIAEGQDIADATGAATQKDVQIRGHALQSRVTTEDPQNNFIPDYGRLTAYRAATGMGIRLDGGTAYSGGVITRHYDSLLVKITAWAPTEGEAIARMDRALREFRIRGVATNIAFIENLLKHPEFLSKRYTTRFIDSTPELYRFHERRDRATKILKYIADVTVNGHPQISENFRAAGRIRDAIPPADLGLCEESAKDILDRNGAQAVVDWIGRQQRLLITETAMRDGHQSLMATRMRSIDMIKVASSYGSNLPGLFSVECWGGATFDVAYRFLQECPWQRLRDLRRCMPRLLLQMLLRGSNGVGYTSYPDNAVQFFIAQAAETGIDLFRVFDSLNCVENMRVAIDAVLETGRLCEGAICYTGDILDPERSKYDVDYYVDLGQQLKGAGAHILGLKDMAGLLKPAAARVLISTLKDELGLPVHFHTHDTGGLGVASVLAANEAGVDIVDAAVDAFSGGTSQPCLGSIIEALRRSESDTGLNASAVRGISTYFEQVRSHYAAFDDGLPAPASEIFLHEMPGGQFSNLKAQARSLGLEDRWPDIAEAYAEMNLMLGDIVKVTPTSKVVGDLALMMVSQGLTRTQVEDPDFDMSFPESAVEMMRGRIGDPPGGFPAGIRNKILKGEAPATGRPGASLAPIDIEKTRQELSGKIGGQHVDNEDLSSYLMYPKVFLEYTKNHQQFGPVRTLPTGTFFYGMNAGEEISVEIDPGKILEIRLLAVGETNEKGEVRVFFELNGQPRVVRIRDRKTVPSSPPARKAEPDNPCHVAAPMPGTVASLAVKEGQTVSRGDLLLTVEAMKMETGIYSERSGRIKSLYVGLSDIIDAKDLLVELELET